MYLIFLSSSCPPPISSPIDTIMILLFMSLFLFSLVLAKYPLSPFPAYSQFFSLNCFLTLSISPFHCLLLPLFFLLKGSSRLMATALMPYISVSFFLLCKLCVLACFYACRHVSVFLSLPLAHSLLTFYPWQPPLLWGL